MLKLGRTESSYAAQYEPTSINFYHSLGFSKWSVMRFRDLCTVSKPQTSTPICVVDVFVAGKVNDVPFMEYVGSIVENATFRRPRKADMKCMIGHEVRSKSDGSIIKVVKLPYYISYYEYYSSAKFKA